MHFPYCRQRCSYCDFNAHLAPIDGERAFRDYHEALLVDIHSLPAARVRSIFWGGGTPSLMPLPYLVEIQRALGERLQWTADLENTLEVNPATMGQGGFEALRANGWNRVSLGAQAFQPHLLEMVGRIHTAAEIEIAVRAARAAGFDNISLDLIYGLPQQTLAHWKETLERALSLEPEHLSVYALTVEPSTRLEKQLQQGELHLPDEDSREAMDHLSEDLLVASGFHRYEISNWARPGRESQHNLLYWNDSPYLGVGCGAVSFYDGWRRERIKPPLYYQKAIAEGRSPVSFAERRDHDGALKDALMMGLRVSHGVSVRELAKRFPGLCQEQMQSFFERLPDHWWRRDGDRYTLTRAGWDFHSEVTMELMSVLFSFS